VAVFTFNAKSAVMFIILVVAEDAARCDDKFIILYGRIVAIATAYRLMLTLQLEPGLVVVKIPTHPVAVVVAHLAVGTKPESMHILLGMTRPAIGFHVLE
jgi:hypothetical protein